VHLLERSSGFPEASMPDLLDAALRDFDVIVVDLPRHLDDVAAACARASDLTLMLLPGTPMATRAGRALGSVLARHARDLRVVVRNTAPPGFPLDVLTEALGLPVAAWMRPEPGLARGLVLAEPPGLRRRSPLATAARAVLQQGLAGHYPSDRPYPVRAGSSERWVERLVDGEQALTTGPVGESHG
jgi:hypothetical protein